MEFGSKVVNVGGKSVKLQIWDTAGQERFRYGISSVIRQEFLSFQNNPKNLDPSYKMDLGLWDWLGREKLVL